MEQVRAAAHLSQHMGVSANVFRDAEELVPPEHTDCDSVEPDPQRESRSAGKRKREQVQFSPSLIGYAIPSEDDQEESDNREYVDMEDADDMERIRVPTYQQAQQGPFRVPSSMNDSSIKRRKRTDGTPFPTPADARPTAYRDRPELDYMIPRSDGYNIVSGRDYDGDREFDPSWIAQKPSGGPDLVAYNRVKTDAEKSYQKLRLLGQKYMDHMMIRQKLLHDTPLHYLVMVRFAGSLGIENKDILTQQDYVNNTIQSIQDSIKAKIEQFEKAAKRAEVREVHLSKNLATLRQELVVWSQIKSAPLFQGPSITKRFQSADLALLKTSAVPFPDPVGLKTSEEFEQEHLAKWRLYAVNRFLPTEDRAYTPNVQSWALYAPGTVPEFDDTNINGFVNKFLPSQIRIADTLAVVAEERPSFEDLPYDAFVDEDGLEMETVGDEAEKASKLLNRRRAAIVLLLLWNAKASPLDVEVMPTIRVSSLLDERIGLYRRLHDFVTTALRPEMPVEEARRAFAENFGDDENKYATPLNAMEVDESATVATSTQAVASVISELRRHIADTVKREAISEYPIVRLRGQFTDYKESISNVIRELLAAHLKRLFDDVDETDDEVSQFRSVMTAVSRQKQILTRLATQFTEAAQSSEDSRLMNHEQRVNILKAVDYDMNLGMVDQLNLLETGLAIDVGKGLLHTPFVNAEHTSEYSEARMSFDSLRHLWDVLWKLSETALSTRRTALALNLQFYDASETVLADRNGKSTSAARRRLAEGQRTGGAPTSVDSASSAAIRTGDDMAVDTDGDGALPAASIPYESIPNLTVLYQTLLDLQRKDKQQLAPYFGHVDGFGDLIPLSNPLKFAYANLMSYMMATSLRMGPFDANPPKTRLMMKWITDLAYLCEDDTSRALIITKGTDLTNLLFNGSDVSIFDLAGHAALFYLAVTRDKEHYVDEHRVLLDNGPWASVLMAMHLNGTSEDLVQLRNHLQARAELLEKKLEETREAEFRMQHPLRFMADSANLASIEQCLAWFSRIAYAVDPYRIHVFADARLAVPFTLIALEVVQFVVLGIGEAVALAKTDLNSRFEYEVEMAKQKLMSKRDAQERDQLEEDLQEVLVRGKDLLDPAKTGMVIYNNVVEAAFDQAESWIRDNAPILMGSSRMSNWKWTSLIADRDAVHSDFAGVFADIAANKVADSRFRKNSIVQTAINTAYHQKDLDELRRRVARFTLHPSGNPAYPIRK